LKDRFVFSYFGKLTARKAVDKIIEAFRIVQQMQPSAFLLIAGNGPDRSRLEALGADLVKAGSLQFMGRVPNGGEGALLHAMDAYLSFSQGGLGILEAMATARTIISTPEVFPETELLKGDYNCFLSADFSTGAFAAAMEKAIREPEQAKAVGLQARKTVKEKAGTTVMVNAFVNAIRHTLNQ
jgi:glycosyltransferase involved in cell wall biosynthesis